MTAIHAGERHPSGKLGDVISNVTVRGFFCELVDMLADLHEGVEVQHGPVDIRAEYAGKSICRIVPYRELVHLHIGESPVWEVRVREETGYLEAVDRILDVYLTLVSEAGRSNGKYRGSSFLSR